MSTHVRIPLCLQLFIRACAGIAAAIAAILFYFWVAENVVAPGASRGIISLLTMTGT